MDRERERERWREREREVEREKERVRERERESLCVCERDRQRERIQISDSLSPIRFRTSEPELMKRIGSESCSANPSAPPQARVGNLKSESANPDRRTHASECPDIRLGSPDGACCSRVVAVLQPCCSRVAAQLRPSGRSVAAVRQPCGSPEASTDCESREGGSIRPTAAHASLPSSSVSRVFRVGSEIIYIKYR